MIVDARQSFSYVQRRRAIARSRESTAGSDRYRRRTYPVHAPHMLTRWRSAQIARSQSMEWRESLLLPRRARAGGTNDGPVGAPFVLDQGGHCYSARPPPTASGGKSGNACSCSGDPGSALTRSEQDHSGSRKQVRLPTRSGTRYRHHLPRRPHETSRYKKRRIRCATRLNPPPTPPLSFGGD
jgi:hypothetical protein